MKPSDITNKFSDKNLERAFIGSALFGLGAFVLPAVAPVALVGMIGSQAIFWTKQFTKDTPDNWYVSTSNSQRRRVD